MNSKILKINYINDKYLKNRYLPLFRGKQVLSLEIFLPVLNVKASRGRGREATTRQVVSLMNEGKIVGRKVWNG